jgi:hypothetical protein
MGKKIGDEWVNIAPDIRARKRGNRTIVEDLKTNTQLNINNIDDKIKMYERQVKEWFFKRVSYSMRGKNYGFIGLMVCLAHLEGVQEYREGVRSDNRERRNRRNRRSREHVDNPRDELVGSKEFFVASLKRIYGDQYLEPQLEKFYEQARCGLFHDGMTKEMVRYNYEFPQALDFNVEGLIKVNPKVLLKDIKKDFIKYLKELRTVTNTDLRTNFNNMHKFELL